jgi:hypothetical protein
MYINILLLLISVVKADKPQMFISPTDFHVTAETFILTHSPNLTAYQIATIVVMFQIN